MLFCSILLHPDSQYLFAFTFKGRHLTWTRLPHGFIDSLKVHTVVLRGDLKELIFSGGSALLQYADDLFIESLSKEACHIDCVLLLKRLAECSHKGSLQKFALLLARGHLSGSCVVRRSVSPARVKLLTIIIHPL